MDLLYGYKLSLAKDLVSRLKTYCLIPLPSPQQSSTIFNDLLMALGSPTPPNEIYGFFLKPSIISELIRLLHNRYPELRADITCLKRLEYDNLPIFYRVRELGVLGSYPNIFFSRRSQSYVIQNGLPYLITKNKMSAESNAGTFYTEISHTTRSEIKMAASFLAPETSTGLCLYFDGRTRDANAQLLEDVPNNLKNSFLVEYATLFNGIENDYRLYGPHHQTPGRDSFEYRSFFMDCTSLKKFYDAFSINDFLTLRVATYLVKGTMLWRPEPFREEAVANIFFALEGCLLLLQRKHNLQFDRVDRKILPKLFNNLFLQGEGLFDFIDEAIGWGGRRASIVHPQVDNDYSWLPSLSADDYYEYHEIVRMLLNYILTDYIYSEFKKTS